MAGHWTTPAPCADVTAPLDYTDPAGRTITVAISRLKATGAAHRVGALLLNEGGPAGPSLHMPLTKSKVMGDIAGRYHLIGMDPRFVGRSTPLDCGWDFGSAFLRSAGSDTAAYRDEVTDGMGLVNRAGPGIEEQADQVAEAACELADAAAGSGWSMVAVEDALIAIDTLPAALAQVDQEVAEVLAAVTVATATARRRFGLPVEPDPVPSGPEWAPDPHRARHPRPRRRGLGPGFQGIR